MKDLTTDKKLFFEKLLELKPQIHNGYAVFVSKKKKKYKRSRIIMQLNLNKELEIWEIVHHKNKNRLDDRIENLEIIDIKHFNHHASLHHAGSKKPRIN